MAEAAKIGQRIQRLREESDLSLSQLADRSTVSKGYLWKLEKGATESRPSAETLYKIARALGTSMSALIGKSVLVDEPKNIPPSLEKFAEQEELRPREKAMLAQISFRGRQPERSEDWAFLWDAIKRSMPERPRRSRGA